MHFIKYYRSKSTVNRQYAFAERCKKLRTKRNVCLLAADNFRRVKFERFSVKLSSLKLLFGKGWNGEEWRFLWSLHNSLQNLQALFLSRSLLSLKRNDQSASGRTRLVQATFLSLFFTFSYLLIFFFKQIDPSSRAKLCRRPRDVCATFGPLKKEQGAQILFSQEKVLVFGFVTLWRCF